MAAPSTGKDTTILVDEWNLSGHSNQVTLQLNNDRIDVTPFESDDVFIQNPAAATLQHNGYLSQAAPAGGLEEAIYSRLGSSEGYVAVLLGTNTVGCATYVLPRNGAQNLQVQAPVKNVITVQGAWGAGTGVVRGRRVFSGTINATGAKPGVDFTAAGTAGGHAYLFVQAIAGTATDAEIDVESDTDSGFGTAASEGTFTFSAVGVYAIALSGTVNRHIRINTTSLGGATSFDVYAVVAIDGVTYFS